MKKQTKKTNVGNRQQLVACSHVAMAATDSLKPHPQNVNKHPKEQIELLAKIIDHQGWRAPIIVSKRSGYIVAGHARLEAAKLLEASEVPVDLQDFETEADELAHLVADNRIAELADTDFSGLSSLLKSMPQGFDLALTGFKDHELDNLLKANWEPPAIEPFENSNNHGEALHITKEQREVFDRAKGEVMKSVPDANDGRALELICTDYLARMHD